MKDKLEKLPDVRGRYTQDAPLGAKGWFRCGGTADILFKPADLEDLQYFLQNYNPSPDFAYAQSPSPLGRGKANDSEQGEGNVSIFGALSNCIIRDGGVRGVVIRLGREFSKIEVDGDLVTAGALALDANVAKVAAENGLGGLEFLSGIPGSVGGAVKMNAGCYGTETKDILLECMAIDRQGDIHRLVPRHSDEGRDNKKIGLDDNKEIMTMTYRHNDVPDDYIFINATFRCSRESPEIVKQRIADIKKSREESQPIREKTGGSTFANPSQEDLEKAGLPLDTKVWKLIDDVGGRGLEVGGAQMSVKHCNFMINNGGATASDLEALGEEIRKRVAEFYGITLCWEIRRIGESI